MLSLHTAVPTRQLFHCWFCLLIRDFKASNGWLELFKKRHRETITGRKPELLDPARAAAGNVHSMRNELATRIHALEEVDRLNGGEGIAENVKPSHILNTDEMGIWATRDRRDVIAVTGLGDCQIIGSDHGEKISAALLICADGHSGAPYYILKGARPVSKKLDANGRLNGVSEHSEFGFTSGGNMTGELWDKGYAQFLVKEIRRHVPAGAWVLLTMDQYGAHLSRYATLKYLRDNHILCYCPHAHSTHFTQALDDGIIRAVKASFRKLLSRAMFENGNARISKWELPELVSAAWKGVTSTPSGQSLVRNSFRNVGLCPLDRQFVERNIHLTKQLASSSMDDGMEGDHTQHNFNVNDPVFLMGQDGVVLAKGRIGERRTALSGRPMDEGDYPVLVCSFVAELEILEKVSLLYRDENLPSFKTLADIMEEDNGALVRTGGKEGGYLTGWRGCQLRIDESRVIEKEEGDKNSSRRRSRRNTSSADVILSGTTGCTDDEGGQ